MNERNYTIQKTNCGFELSGPVLTAPSVFETEAQAISLARHLIAAKAGGGYITRRQGWPRVRLSCSFSSAPAGCREAGTLSNE